MSILRDINYIKELNRIPCATPSPWIIVKTAFQSAPPALLSLLQPGCNDIVKTRIGRSPWHAKGISSLIKNAIGPQALGGNKFLYEVGYNTAERYLWYWMLADVTKEFFMTWQSQIFQEQQCELPGAGTASGYFAPFVYGLPSTSRLVPSITRSAPGVSISTFNIVVRPGFQGSLGFSVEWDSYPIPGSGVNATTWFTVDDDDTKNDFARTNEPGQGNYNRTGGSIYHNRPGVPTPTRYAVWAEVDPEPGKFVRIINSSWNIGLQGRREGNLSWGCNLKPVTWPFPNPLG